VLILLIFIMFSFTFSTPSIFLLPIGSLKICYIWNITKNKLTFVNLLVELFFFLIIICFSRITTLLSLSKYVRRLFIHVLRIISTVSSLLRPIPSFSVRPSVNWPINGFLLSSPSSMLLSCLCAIRNARVRIPLTDPRVAT